MLTVAETAINIIFNFSSANSVKMFFQRRIRFWLRIYDNWKGTYTAARFLSEFKTENWTTGGLKTSLEKIDGTGSIDCVTGSDRPRTAHTAGNVTAVSQWRRRLCPRTPGTLRA